MLKINIIDCPIEEEEEADIDGSDFQFFDQVESSDSDDDVFYDNELQLLQEEQKLMRERLSQYTVSQQRLFSPLNLESPFSVKSAPAQGEEPPKSRFTPKPNDNLLDSAVHHTTSTIAAMRRGSTINKALNNSNRQSFDPVAMALMMKGVDLNINSENPSNNNSDEEDEEKKSSTKLNEEGEDEPGLKKGSKTKKLFRDLNEKVSTSINSLKKSSEDLLFNSSSASSSHLPVPEVEKVEIPSPSAAKDDILPLSAKFPSDGYLGQIPLKTEKTIHTLDYGSSINGRSSIHPPSIASSASNPGAQVPGQPQPSKIGSLAKVKANGKRDRDLSSLHLIQELGGPLIASEVPKVDLLASLNSTTVRPHIFAPSISETTTTTAVDTPPSPQQPNLFFSGAPLGTSEEENDFLVLSEIYGTVWSMKFSDDGKFLAVGGQDEILRVWTLNVSGDLDEESEAAEQLEAAKHREILHQSFAGKQSFSGYTPTNSTLGTANFGTGPKLRKKLGIFKKIPIRIYAGHDGPILDIAWSRNNFLCSSSMDKTIRLYHVSKKECLCVFLHPEPITGVKFHPLDDRYLLSGCLDSRIRIWSLAEKKIKYWNELQNNALITAVSFTLDGSLVVIGTFTGDCVFYDFEELKYHTQVEIAPPSAGNKKARKITGIEPMPKGLDGNERLLITSNDSRIRIYSLKDKSIQRKFKGLENKTSQIKATIKDDGEFIICGSDNRYFYVWHTENTTKQHFGVLNTIRNISSAETRSKSSLYEKVQVCDEGSITCAIFAPRKTRLAIDLYRETPRRSNVEKKNELESTIIVATDTFGRIKVYENKSPYEVTDALKSTPLKGGQDVGTKRQRSMSVGPKLQSMMNKTPDPGEFDTSLGSGSAKSDSLNLSASIGKIRKLERTKSSSMLPSFPNRQTYNTTTINEPLLKKEEDNEAFFLPRTVKPLSAPSTLFNPDIPYEKPKKKKSAISEQKVKRNSPKEEETRKISFDSTTSSSKKSDGNPSSSFNISPKQKFKDLVKKTKQEMGDMVNLVLNEINPPSPPPIFDRESDRDVEQKELEQESQEDDDEEELRDCIKCGAHAFKYLKGGKLKCIECANIMKA